MRPTIESVMAKLARHGALFAADEVSVLADALRAAGERAAELEKAARRVVDCWEVFRMGSVGWGPIYEPLVALRAALSPPPSPDTEETSGE